MAVSDAICYLYSIVSLSLKLYDEKSKWWYLDNETLYEVDGAGATQQQRGFLGAEGAVCYFLY